MTVISNAKGGKAIVKYIATGYTNTSILTVGDETVNELYIDTVMWVGSWIVERGANTVMNLHGNGLWDFKQHGMSLQEDATANVVATLESGNGTIIMTLNKLSTVPLGI